MHVITTAFLTLLACTGTIVSAPARAESSGTVHVTAQPDPVWIEQGKGQQLLSVDFLIDNQTAEQIELAEIEATVLGTDDRLIAQYRVGANGLSVLVVPNRFVEPGQQQLVFNPLYAFPQGMDLDHVRFTFRFDVGDQVKHRSELLLAPRPYAPRVKLQLPFAGQALVHDGHDFYGHHRRLPLLDPMAVALGWKRNFMRYSYDFVVTDAQGRMYRGDGAKNEDWYGWGTPILAPAGGKVIRVVSDAPDNAKGQRPPFTREQFIADPAVMWGNHVEIDHGNGEVSLLAHMQHGSVKLKVGDAVKAGQRIGAMGFSGDAFLLHLHYDLKSGPGFDVDGLPAPFAEFERLVGSEDWLPVRQGQVDSGDMVRRRGK